MTTIAYKDGVMAGDTGCSGDHVRFGQVRKVHVLPDGALFGFSGPAGAGQTLLRELERSIKPPQAGDALSLGGTVNLSAIYIAADGTQLELVSEQGFGHWVAFDTPYRAIGAGSFGALCAMAVGASAAQAVAVCMIHNSHTFGQIQTVKTKAVLEAENRQRAEQTEAQQAAERKAARQERIAELQRQLAEELSPEEEAVTAHAGQPMAGAAMAGEAPRERVGRRVPRASDLV